MKLRHLLVASLSTLCASFMFSPLAMALDVNQANVQQLDEIKGLGQKRAQAIVDERTKNGPFKSAQDLADRVKGIGDQSVKKLLASGLTVNGSSIAPVTEQKPMKTKASVASATAASAPASSQAISVAPNTPAQKPKTMIIPPAQKPASATSKSMSINMPPAANAKPASAMAPVAPAAPSTPAAPAVPAKP